MCDPMTIATVVSVATTVASGYNDYQMGKAEGRVHEYNARLSENEAIRTRNKGVDEENKHREYVAQMISRQKTQQAANNLDLNSGSPLSLREDAARLGEADAMQIRENFTDQADALDSEKELSLASASAARAKGRNSFATSLLKAGGTAVSAGIDSSWFSADSSATTAMNYEPSAFAGYA